MQLKYELLRMCYWVADRIVALWKLILIASALFGIAGAYVYWPQVEFTIGEALDKTDPLETRFTIANKSVYRLVRTQYLCSFRPERPRQGTRSTFFFQVGPSGFESIKTGASQSVYCGPTAWWYKNAPSGGVYVQLNYELPFVPFYAPSAGALFIFRRDKANEVHWLPFGSSNDLQSAMKFLEQNYP